MNFSCKLGYKLSSHTICLTPPLPVLILLEITDFLVNRIDYQSSSSVTHGMRLRFGARRR